MKPRLKYANYHPMTLELIFSKPCLGGFPSNQSPYWTQDESQPSKYFDQVLHRNADGNPIISRGQLRGLVRDSARFMGASSTIKDYIFAEDCIITVRRGRKVGILKKTRQVCIPVNAGGVGRGLVRHEAAPIGSSFLAQFLIPTSVVEPGKFANAMITAGKTIGLGAHRKLGFGSFHTRAIEDLGGKTSDHM